jgi:uncharacterized protein
VRIVNASPLILLARVGCLELLREPSESDVTVPDVAFREVLAGESFDPHVGTIRVAAGDWLRVAPSPTDVHGLDPDRLDAGELAVLSLAIENPGAIVVLDDRAAREEAIRRDIPLLGTAGILLRAKQQGRIAAVRPPLDAVRQVGLYSRIASTASYCGWPESKLQKAYFDEGNSFWDVRIVVSRQQVPGFHPRKTNRSVSRDSPQRGLRRRWA